MNKMGNINRKKKGLIILLMRLHLIFINNYQSNFTKHPIDHH